MDDVMPFLENVLRGRNVPRERMLSVAKHYELFGGVSPINEQNRKLIAALKEELQTNGPQLPIYFGNRNWHPLLADTLRTMRDDGVKQALAFVTSAYSSYSSCRQYLEDIERARAAVGPDAPPVEKLRAFYNHPAFIEANIASVGEALEQIPEERRTRSTSRVHSSQYSGEHGTELRLRKPTARGLAPGSRRIGRRKLRRLFTRLSESQWITIAALAGS